MIVDAKFSVKDKASFVPGELVRFHAAGRTRLGVVREDSTEWRFRHLVI